MAATSKLRLSGIFFAVVCALTPGLAPLGAASAAGTLEGFLATPNEAVQAKGTLEKISLVSRILPEVSEALKSGAMRAVEVVAVDGGFTSADALAGHEALDGNALLLVFAGDPAAPAGEGPLSLALDDSWSAGERKVCAPLLASVSRLAAAVGAADGIGAGTLTVRRVEGLPHLAAYVMPSAEVLVNPNLVDLVKAVPADALLASIGAREEAIAGLVLAHGAEVAEGSDTTLVSYLAQHLDSLTVPEEPGLLCQLCYQVLVGYINEILNVLVNEVMNLCYQAGLPEIVCILLFFVTFFLLVPVIEAIIPVLDAICAPICDAGCGTIATPDVVGAGLAAVVVLMIPAAYILYRKRR